MNNPTTILESILPITTLICVVLFIYSFLSKTSKYLNESKSFDFSFFLQTGMSAIVISLPILVLKYAWFLSDLQLAFLVLVVSFLILFISYIKELQISFYFSIFGLFFGAFWLGMILTLK
jgi:hypothetical protein